MPNLLYLGHEFHIKTRSTIFLQELLAENYEVEFCPLIVHGSEGIPNYSSIKKNHYDVVVFFQLMPSIAEFQKYISFDRGVLFPMADYYFQECPVSAPRWKEYRNFQIINFSSAVHKELQAQGFSSHYIQFFPKVNDSASPGSETSLFFWQRINPISINTVELLFNFWTLDSIHLHRAIDPGHQFIPPSKRIQNLVQYSDWFDAREEMLEKIEESALYMAPRAKEGIGMSYLEAMAMGRCVIAPNDSTMNEYITHGENGLLYDLSQPAPLARCDIRRIQKNTLRFMKNGFEKWNQEKSNILDWIKEPLSTDFAPDPKVRFNCKDYQSNIKNALKLNYFNRPKTLSLTPDTRPKQIKRNEEKSEKPHVLFDISVLVYGGLDLTSRTGIYFVAINVLKKFIKDDRIKLSCFYSGEESPESKVINKLYSEIGFFGDTVYGATTREGLYCQIASADIFFSPIFRIPEIVEEFPGICKFTLLYDTIVIDFPEFFKNSPQPYFHSLLDSINPHDSYFAISESTKRDFLHHSSAAPSNIMVTHLAASERFFPNLDQADAAAMRSKYKIPQGSRYALTLSSLEPRKNLVRTIQAFILFKQQVNADDFILVVSGHPWNKFFESLQEQCPEFEQYRDHILFTGYIDDSDLSSLYSNAEFFVYTSLYEGFGLPLLEAMQCGLPVICSNNSSIPEVVGDAALMVDACSVEDIVNAYTKLYNDESLRKTLAAKGLDRAKCFNWQKTSDIMVENILSKFNSRKIEISVITVIKNLVDANRSLFFRQCFNSVQSQKGVKIEYIIYDGGSTDGTVDMVKSLIKGYNNVTFVSEPDNGVYDAMNKAALISRGEYLVFLNSDDYWHDPLGLLESYNTIKKYDADFSFASACIIDTHDKYLETLIPWPGAFLCRMPFCHQTMLTKIELFMDMGMFDCDFKSAADYDFVLRLFLTGKKGVQVEHTFTTYRMGGLSHIMQANSEQELRFSLKKNLYHITGNADMDCYLDIFNGMIPKTVVEHASCRLSPVFRNAFMKNIAITENAHIFKVISFRFEKNETSISSLKKIGFRHLLYKLKTVIKSFLKLIIPNPFHKHIKKIFINEY